jgi:tetratricopeptide (TPR) repeat protein
MSTPLRTARRLRGWSQARLIHDLGRLASARHIPIATSASLKTLVSRWENGHATPAEPYRRLLCEIYALDGAALGFTAPSTTTSIGAIPSVSNTPDVRDPEIVSHFYRVLDEFTVADNVIGPAYALAPVRSHLGFAQELCKSARGRVHRDLLTVRAWYAGRSAWLSRETGDLDGGEYWADRVLDYGLELEDTHLTAYAYNCKASIAIARGAAGPALAFAKASLRERGRISPLLSGLGLNQLAWAHALAGNHDECHRALDSATAEIAAEAEDPHNFGAYVVPSLVEVERVGCLSQLGRPTEAIELFEARAGLWPTRFRRNYAVALSRVASAYAAVDEVAKACSIAEEALALARETRSVTPLRQLHRVRRQLAPYGGVAVVEQFGRRLDSVNGAGRRKAVAPS